MPTSTADPSADVPGFHHAHLEVVHDGQQPFEQHAVGVLHGVFLLALETLAGVFQVGALTQGVVAVLDEFGLELRQHVLGDFPRRVRCPSVGRCLRFSGVTGLPSMRVVVFSGVFITYGSRSR